MPTTEPFTALGRGNGFPFFPTRLAVRPVDGDLGMSTNDYNAQYATFNGGDFTGLGGGTGFGRAFSNMQDAMKIFWNLHSFTLSADASWESTVNDNSDSASITGKTLTQAVEVVPKKRVCRFNTPTFRWQGEGNQIANFLFSGIYYFKDAGVEEYYWGLVSTWINPGIGVGSLLPRTYERRTSDVLNEYSPFVLTIDDPSLQIDMAYYIPGDGIEGSASGASIDSVEYYTY